jgi:DNA replication protein DnaC
MKNESLGFFKDEDKWFLLCGQSGFGKTHICTAIDAEGIKQGKHAVYFDLIEETAKCMNCLMYLSVKG